MKVVRFLERTEVIRFFGIALLLAPIINFSLHVLIVKFQSGVAWSQFQYLSILRTTNFISFILAICSVTIGVLMLTSAKKAWTAVLFLIGTHLLVQILNIGDKAWKGPLAWPSFILNAGLFFFIMDQLVWKIQPVNNNTPLQNNSFKPVLPLRKVINLKSYRKILFSFGADKPWGEMKTLSSEMITVRSFAPAPSNMAGHTLQLNFSKDVVVDIEFERQENDLYFFKPLNMDKEKVTNLNNWLTKIAI